MISRCPNVLIAASMAWLGWISSPAIALQPSEGITKELAPLAQTPLGEKLSIGSQGEPVTELQRTLNLLGYFEGEVNGVYTETTAAAVTKFQKATSLPGITTILAKAGDAQKAPQPIWTSPWVLGGLGATGVVGAAVLALTRRSRRTEPDKAERGFLMELPPAQESHSIQELNGINNPQLVEEHASSDRVFSPPLGAISEPKERPESAVNSVATTSQVTETTRISKINIVDELIQDLRNPDPSKRHKVIWELGQRGDTRAVQPLVDLMIDSDSRQRSLILSALSEIGTRTLKPLTRALAISLQDENAEVRKNAIRDLTRVYDMVTQISNLLHKAADDPDRDVQETAKWALGQLNRIRPAPGMELPALKNAVSPPESLP